ncbi:ABC transporter substrate-binding protein [Pikeienuella sp. HZG-20]|uniref:ABC transporter substrate-binding protein n=1 Tax=Paludibacillus litoralis TaxID=3133267 RepID=UPI0030EB7C98
MSGRLPGRLARAWLGVALIVIGAAARAGDGEPPRRVVSVNLCTDELAMLLAAPGQLVSVSHIAWDPLSNPMAAAARAYPANFGRAEEIWLLEPDLVLAGEFTAPPVVAMLRRLGVEVRRFPLATTGAEIVSNLRRMGEALGREAAAETAIAVFEARLAALPELDGPRPRAAIYQANGWTVGGASLGGWILATAGLANVAAEFGIERGGALPLEALVMAAPDLIITGARYPGASEAEAVPRHPALKGIPSVRAVDADWVCGGPHALDAVEAMAAARLRLGRRG